MFNGESILLNVVKKFFREKPQFFIFWSTLIFYILLWSINPGNKLIALSFLVLIGFYYFRFKNIRISTMLAYLTSVVVLSGKMYMIELIPANIYNSALFPMGHVTTYVITSSMILAFILAVFLARDYFTGNLYFPNIKNYEYFILFYFIWFFVSDLVGSERPDVSLVYSIANFEPLILFLSLRCYVGKLNRFIPLVLGLIAAQVVFESVVSFQQYSLGSVANKNIEVQTSTSTFGQAPDELEYRFRPAGTFRHANQLAMWMGFWLSILFVFFYKKRNRFYFSVFLLGTACLIITLSRSVWMGYAISILFSLYILEKIKKIKTPAVVRKHFLSVGLVFVVLIILFILPRAEKSFYAFSEGGGLFRQEQLREALLVIYQKPIFGVGSAYSVVAGLDINPTGYFSRNPTSIHNFYATITAEHGIPVIVFYVIFIYIFLRTNLNLILLKPMKSDTSYLRLGFVAGVFLLLITLFFQPYNVTTLLLFACAILGRYEHDTKQKSN